MERYGSTAVLCTATQPELQPLFDESFDGDHVRVPEISPFTRDDRDSFRRVTIKRLGDIALDALAERLGHHKQVLCVVNTRSKAQCLHDRLAEDDAEGSFCLTTLQCAADRQRLFAEIRDRLDAGASCRVVSTSLIEAGVDVDFPVAYREEAGLDSVIQTAGRCNREGRRPVSESVVHVFTEPHICGRIQQSYDGIAHGTALTSTLSYGTSIWIPVVASDVRTFVRALERQIIRMLGRSNGVVR